MPHEARVTAALTVPRRRLVIFNPAAGRSPKRRLRAILDHLKGLGCSVELSETTARGDAEAMARAADPQRVDIVVAAGGDGTVNEVANGLASSDSPLAILPLGTGNVLANEIGLPRDPPGLASLLASGVARPVWLGEIEDGGGVVRRFTMMAGIGFDANVVTRLDERLKQRIGKLAFVLAIAAELARYRVRRYMVTCDGIEHRAASAVIAKGHFYAGRFILAPDARLDEPWLDLVLFERAGRLAAIKYLLAMAFGVLHRLSDIRILRTKSVQIAAPEGAAVESDGDIVASLPVTIRVAERPIWVIQPG
jgi:diacylglycerol kinase (ATP)